MALRGGGRSPPPQGHAEYPRGRSPRNPPKEDLTCWYNGESDSNQTQFETWSNQGVLGVMARGKKEATVLLLAVRIVVDASAFSAYAPLAEYADDNDEDPFEDPETAIGLWVDQYGDNTEPEPPVLMKLQSDGSVDSGPTPGTARLRALCGDDRRAPVAITAAQVEGLLCARLYPPVRA